MVGWPSIPRSAAVIFLDQNTKERVIVQPRRLLFTESLEFPSSLFASVSGEIRKRLLENALLKSFDWLIVYAAAAEGWKIDLCQRILNILTRQILGRTWREV